MKSVFKDTLPQKTEEELKLAKVELTNESVHVKADIEEMRRNRWKTGVRAPQEEYERLLNKQVVINAHIRMIDGELSIRKERRNTSSERLAVLFMKVARRELDEEVFEALLAIARQEFRL